MEQCQHTVQTKLWNCARHGAMCVFWSFVPILLKEGMLWEADATYASMTVALQGGVHAMC